jgi:hypothetical protein
MTVEYGAFGGMRIGRGNRSTRRKPTAVTPCPPQIPHDLTWYRPRAAEAGSQDWYQAAAYTFCTGVGGKCWQRSARLHGVTSQKTAAIILISDCGDETCVHLSYKDRVGNLRADERLIYNFIIERCGVDWIKLTQDGVQLWV